jgi:toxin ParE1/3/4
VQVYFTRAAREDLITTWAHIAEDNPQAADRVLDRL